MADVQQLPDDLLAAIERLARERGLDNGKCELGVEAVLENGRCLKGFVTVKLGPLSRSEISALGSQLFER